MEKRIDKIRQKLKADGRVTVAELSRLYSVTEETIRRDLEKLETESFLTRTFGGAVLNTTPQKDHIHFYKRASVNRPEKKKIAALTAPLLAEKRTIIADASTTVMEAVKLLRDRKSTTVITSSTEIFHELNDAELCILSTGGLYNKSSLSLQGSFAKACIKNYNPDIALISCKGLDLEKGVTDSSDQETDVKSAMIGQSAEVALLADHSKFDRIAFVKFLDLHRVDYLITDKKPDSRWIEFCAQTSIHLIYE